MICTGPSSSGKTELVRRLIKNDVYEREIKKVCWCFSVYQKWMASEPEIKFVCGLPPEEETFDLVVFDDLQSKLNEEVELMFRVTSHHKNFSVILITQNLFPKVKVMRDISLNTHYIVLFRNNRDASQMSCFARQAFPLKGKYFMDAYKKATREPYSYLFVDVHPLTCDDQRLRASIFPDENFINWVFVPVEQ